MKHVVIAGGGFAGVRLARKLSKQKNFRITIVNKTKYFRYSPALYRAATGFKLGTARIPLEWMLLDSSRTKLVIGAVNRINKKHKIIKLEDGGVIDYDIAVMALGTVTSYFGIDGLNEYSHGLKTSDEVLELKKHLHDELVNKSTNKNYVIVGAGPTGVELAGALGAYLKRISNKHRISNPNVNITLVEASHRILPQMSKGAAKKTHRHLEKLGIEIKLDTKVESESKTKLITSNGGIHTRSVIWTAGTISNPFFKAHPKIFKMGSRGKVIVNNRLQSSSNIYVCGDNAETKHSGLAVTAIAHANFVAKDLKKRINNKARATHKEKAPIQIVPAGNNWAVFEYRKLVLSGKLISVIRRIADINGYTEILGPLRALTIWKNYEMKDEECSICM